MGQGSDNGSRSCQGASPRLVWELGSIVVPLHGTPRPQNASQASLSCKERLCSNHPRPVYSLLPKDQKYKVTDLEILLPVFGMPFSV